MYAIIPAAGIGERLRPLTFKKPKVLLPVAGKPIIGHIYDRLIQVGIDTVTVIIGYLGEMVEEYSRTYPLKFNFVNQSERKGLGHAVGLGLSDKSEPVLIILGDTIIDLNYSELLSRKENVIGVMPVEDPRRFGVVVLEGDKVRRLVEKPEKPISNLAIAGVYLIQDSLKLKRAIDYIIEKDIRTKNEYQLTDALQVLLDWGEKFTIIDIDKCYDCGTRETFLETNQYLLEKSEPNRQLTELFPSAEIEPPVYCGENVVIENSRIGPYVSLGDNVKVVNSKISNSIIDNGAEIMNCELERCLISENIQLQNVKAQDIIN